MNWSRSICRCFESDKVFYTSHARREMRVEEFGPITDQEIYESVCNDDIIEIYADDKPYPSVLIFGMTNAKRPLHALCAYNDVEDQIIIVTVYQPDPMRWEAYLRRKPG